MVLNSSFSVLYFSVHRYDNGDYWPRLAESNYDHIGEGVGVGYNVNVPLNEVRCGRQKKTKDLH